MVVVVRVSAARCRCTRSPQDGRRGPRPGPAPSSRWARPVVVAPFMVVLFMAADVRVDDSGAGMAGPHLARLPVGRPSPGVRGAVRGSTR